MRAAQPRLAVLTTQVSAAVTSRPVISTQNKGRLPISRASSRNREAKMAPTEVKKFDYIVIGGGSGGSGSVCPFYLALCSEWKEGLGGNGDGDEFCGEGS
jgi:hypothetical protein